MYLNIRVPLNAYNNIYHYNVSITPGSTLEFPYGLDSHVFRPIAQLLSMPFKAILGLRGNYRMSRCATQFSRNILKKKPVPGMAEFDQKSVSFPVKIKNPIVYLHEASKFPSNIQNVLARFTVLPKIPHVSR